MTREDFIKQCSLLGVGISLFPNLLSSCSKSDKINVNFSGKVIIIGAGAAGLMAAYTLKKYNIDFEVVEASSVFGGRVKMTDSFADFPIDLGAEWIHTKAKVFGELIDDSSVKGSIDLIPYRLDSMYRWSDGKLRSMNIQAALYGELKFKSSTWYQFFEQYILPSISSQISYDSPVTSIDYSNDQLVVADNNGKSYTGDRVIVTVPLTILKNATINFTPALSQSKLDAIARIDMPAGIKAFIKFSKKFYHDFVTTSGGLIIGDEERSYYNAAFKKDTNQNILGLFNAGPNAEDFTNLETEEEIFQAIMAELDLIYDGQATQYYQDHIIQNWSAEPFIQGSYSFAGSHHSSDVKTISAPINGKVHFAGEALDRESWATVHGAGFNGVATAKTILEGN